MNNNKADDATTTTIPLVLQFGDRDTTSMSALPIVSKFRYAATQHDLNAVTRLHDSATCVQHDSRSPLKTVNPFKTDGYSPILWKLETNRHWDVLDESKRLDTPWDKKLNRSVWRGDFTGAFKRGKTDLETCRSNIRCSFVLDHAGFRWINAGLRSYLGRMESTELDGIQVTKGRLSMGVIQRLKAIISMEGNDVASGLKWSLLSESVLIMAPTTRTSWAMEELLEPDGIFLLHRQLHRGDGFLQRECPVQGFV
jgi:hypothetical protein